MAKYYGKSPSTYPSQQAEQSRAIRNKIREKTLEAIEQDDKTRRIAEARLPDSQDFIT